MTDDDFRALNARLGYPPEAADRLLRDRRADERRERHFRHVGPIDFQGPAVEREKRVREEPYSGPGD